VGKEPYDWRGKPACPDTLYGQHGPPDGRGKCPWCGRKVTDAQPMPSDIPVSDLTESYGMFWDPDYEPNG
jgi:hypothetical protein